MIVPQVAIVKAANVGSRLAQHIIKNNLANAVLLDVLSVHPQAIATYLQEQSGLNGPDSMDITSSIRMRSTNSVRKLDRALMLL